MVRATALAALLLTGACAEKYEEPIEFTPHGSAMRHNMMAQIINPVPPQGGLPPSDGARAVIGIDAYRAGEVKNPVEQSTAPDTIDTGGVN